MSNRTVRKTQNSNAVPGAIITVGCLYITLAIAFWITVFVVAVHFISKLW